MKGWINEWYSQKIFEKWLGGMNLSLLAQIQGRVGYKLWCTGLSKKPPELEKYQLRVA